MTSPVKKSKKKSDAGDADFDCSALIPGGLDNDVQEKIEKFLSGAPMTDNLRKESLVLFVKAMIADCQYQKKTESLLECTAEDRQRINVGWFAGPSDVKEEYDQ
ncbi:hypothetical protein NECAME_10235 [Necator americanus]|uniref:Uncharacterized protein n=1 Tax=Necator americanus TaxID=51031 RepID=W2TBN5_NECAM|nr:hypothetical protein NECAME_10235 [Necator americanus]ETN78606.1 hypothetical protein NECAME_10235 [Necator americanus]